MQLCNVCCVIVLLGRLLCWVCQPLYCFHVKRLLHAVLLNHCQKRDIIYSSLELTMAATKVMHNLCYYTTFSMCIVHLWYWIHICLSSTLNSSVSAIVVSRYVAQGKCLLERLTVWIILVQPPLHMKRTSLVKSCIVLKKKITPIISHTVDWNFYDVCLDIFYQLT